MKHLTLVIGTLMIGVSIYAQQNKFALPTSINTNGSAPDASAILDVQSTSKGMLVPRMTSGQRTSVASPADGLLVFDTNTGSFWFYEGGAWKELTGADGPFIAQSLPVTGFESRSNTGDGFFAENNSDDGYNAASNSNDGFYAVSNDDDGFDAYGNADDGFYARNNADDGFFAFSNSGDGFFAENNSGDGFYAFNNDDDGVYALGNDDDGFYANFNSDDGFYARDNADDGFYAYSNDDDGFHAAFNSGMGYRATSNTYNGFFSKSNSNGFYASTNNFDGFFADSNSDDGFYAFNNDDDGFYATSNSDDGFYAFNNTGDEGYFSGTVTVTGALSKGSGTFKIDHPLDPENKFLYHSFVESPDMMNVYNGNVILDANGEATITMEDWFQPLNRSFRYQLTCIGGHADVYIAEEMTGNRFKIAGGSPGLKVSWQVTGIRQDPYAEQNRVVVEEEKPAEFKGYYIHPEAYGKGFEQGFDFVKLGHKSLEELQAEAERENKEIEAKKEEDNEEKTRTKVKNE